MFDKIKSLFIEEIEDDKGKKAAPVRPKAAPKRNISTPAKAEDSAPVTPQQGEVKDKFMQILFTAMDKSNLDGFDYLEFKNSLNSLKKMQNMDEATRFKSAYAMAQTMGATPATLVETAKHYLNVLRTEETKFEQALEANSQKQIGGRKQELSRLQQNIQTKEEQIKRLQAEIDADKKKYQALHGEIKSSAQKIENTKADFIASYDAIIAQIQRDIQRINEYLK